MKKNVGNQIKHKLYLIHWKDAESCNEWKSEKEIEDWSVKDCLIADVGWIIKETKKYTVICSQVTYDKCWGNKTKIPSGWIASKKRLSI